MVLTYALYHYAVSVIASVLEIKKKLVQHIIIVGLESSRLREREETGPERDNERQRRTIRD